MHNFTGIPVYGKLLVHEREGNSLVRSSTSWQCSLGLVMMSQAQKSCGFVCVCVYRLKKKRFVFLAELRTCLVALAACSVKFAGRLCVVAAVTN